MILLKLIATICVCTVLVISEIKQSYNNDENEFVPVQVEESVKEAAKILDENGSLNNISAQKLMNLYADHGIDEDYTRELDSKLEGKYLKITGTADSINYDYIDGCYIIMYQERKDLYFDGWISLWFYFSDHDEIDKVLKLKEGEEVTIVGYCDEAKTLVNCYVR